MDYGIANDHLQLDLGSGWRSRWPEPERSDIDRILDMGIRARSYGKFTVLAPLSASWV